MNVNKERNGTWAIPFDRPEWRSLSPLAQVAYLFLTTMLDESNNDSKKASHIPLVEVLHMLGSMLSLAFQELEKNGWIQRAKHGGRLRTNEVVELTGKYHDQI